MDYIRKSTVSKQIVMESDRKEPSYAILMKWQDALFKFEGDSFGR